MTTSFRSAKAAGVSWVLWEEVRLRKKKARLFSRVLRTRSQGSNIWTWMSRMLINRQEIVNVHLERSLGHSWSQVHLTGTLTGTARLHELDSRPLTKKRAAKQVSTIQAMVHTTSHSNSKIKDGTLPSRSGILNWFNIKAGTLETKGASRESPEQKAKISYNIKDSSINTFESVKRLTLLDTCPVH